jgi:hypothetical protein
VRDMAHWDWTYQRPQEGAREARPEWPARRGTCPRGAEPEKRGVLGDLSLLRAKVRDRTDITSTSGWRAYLHYTSMLSSTPSDGGDVIERAFYTAARFPLHAAS